jgi:hypothetical protein
LLRGSITGVPRSEEWGTCEPVEPEPSFARFDRYDKTFSEPATLRLVEEPAEGGASHLVPPQSETYISVTVRAPKDGNPGQIEEGRFAVENGAVVLSDYRGIRIASLPLQPGQDPTAVARKLLRQTRQTTEFYRPLHYPDLGVA